MSDYHPPRTVLLVDDDAEFADIASEALNEAGFATLTAPHAWEALRILESERRLDLFLADLRLPPGMPHGFAMARLARNRRPGLKVMYVTAYREIAEEEADRALGKILYKPIRLDALVAEVTRALDGR